jgi:trehalose 6-phosphate synthase/phosphatase
MGAVVQLNVNMNPGLVIVSNRLPVSVKKVDGVLEFFPSVSGLAMGLAPYASNKRNKWIGWPGLASDDLTEDERNTISEELLKHNCYPVFLTQKQIDGFYNGYCNRLIWPLFHDVTLSRSAVAKEQEYWKAYRQVNNIYAESVLARSNSGNNIWVHDYQLMLLPAMLRAERPNDKIGFFLHIPFPPLKSFMKLKDGPALLAGVLGSDLVGFHIVPYANNFLDAVKHYSLGITEPRKVILGDRVVRVTDFPIGIDYAKWRKASKLWAVRKEIARLTLKYRGKKIIITVDRMDPSKGLIERLIAYRTLLEQNPDLHKKVQLVMIAVPSRTDIQEYKRLKKNLEKLVYEINKKFGTLRWQPVDYQYVSLGFEQLRALYERADIAFITPLRDGMNLVAKEYLASKAHHGGVLVLSKTAGAAEELKDAIMVDPSRPASLVRGLKRAILMPRRGFKKRVKSMQHLLSESTVHTWAGGFMKSLRQTNALPQARTATLSVNKQHDLITDYTQAFKRLILLDYDGVLVPFASRPEDAKASKKLKTLLAKLVAERDNIVVVISGRQKENLDEWLGDLGLNFGAEHGAYSRTGSSKSWQMTASSADKKWQAVLLPILEKYAARTPGAFVEQKSTALVWHYRQAKPYYAHKNLLILKRVLKPFAKSLGLRVRQGHMILEVKAADIHKGTVAKEWLKYKPDFVLAMGDDYTDEDMFASLPADSYTIKVGRGRTKAHFRLKNSNEVLQFLEKLSKK